MTNGMRKGKKTRGSLWLFDGDDPVCHGGVERMIARRWRARVGGLQGLWQPRAPCRMTTGPGLASLLSLLLPFSLFLPPFPSPLTYLTTKKPKREACLSGAPQDV